MKSTLEVIFQAVNFMFAMLEVNAKPHQIKYKTRKIQNACKIKIQHANLHQKK